jgi:hypothetical protein
VPIGIVPPAVASVVAPRHLIEKMMSDAHYHHIKTGVPIRVIGHIICNHALGIVLVLLHA